MRFFILGLALLLCACSSQKVEQEGGGLTRGEVEFLSGRMRQAVEAEFPVIKHKLVTRYVNNLGQSIVSRNLDMPPLAYEFKVLRSNEVFVFSLPGGIIYVSLGLLRAMELEGQLAAAISHELAHIQESHPLVAWRRKIINRGQKNIVEFGGPWRGDFLGDTGALFFDRGMEEEADGVAPVILFRAGFDPRLYLSYLEELKKLEKRAPDSVAAMASLHPPLEDRMAWAKKSLLQIPPQRDANVSSATFSQIKSILQEASRKGEKKQDVQ